MLREDCQSQYNRLFEIFFNEDRLHTEDLFSQKEQQIQNHSNINNQYAKKNKKPKFNNSLWTEHENMKYCEFVQENIGLFQSGKKTRQQCKINKQISDFVKTRSANQCRSHHQKMLKYHGSPKGIVQRLSFLRQKIENGQKVPVRMRKRISEAPIIQIVIPLIPIQPVKENVIWDDVLDLNRS